MERKRFIEEFNLLDYNISHKVLLYRGQIKKEIKQNIDLIFEGVFYIEVPTRLHGLILYEADEILKEEILKKISEKFYPELGQTFFVIESDNKRYIIGCNRFLIQENSLIYLESSIK